MTLQPSARIIAFIKGYEKYWKPLPNGDCTSYKPTPFDRWTCGYGSTGRDIGPGLVWTHGQADARFARDLGDFADGVRSLIGSAPTTQGQFDALLSFAYNVGLDIDDDTIAEGLGDSSLLRKHRAGDQVGAAAQFGSWNKQRQNGQLVVLNGLTKRRKAESAIYLGVLT